jgi:hypothetical protein
MLQFTNHKQKMYLARHGPSKVFGREVDTREALGDSEAAAWFDRVWSNSLERAARDGVPVEAESALDKIPEHSRPYFRRDAEHREFRLSGCLFVAQVQDPNGCDQLWFIPSTSGDPRTLYVNFDTVDEREQFAKVASSLGWKGEELGLQLVRDFVRKVVRRGNSWVIPQSQPLSIEISADHRRWAEAASRRYRKPKSYCLDLIVQQGGRCAFSGARLKFDAPSGTPIGGGAGCHPLYAALDHCAPGSDDKGHQIVCYDLNDLKGQLRYDCFEDLRTTPSWQRLMEKWRQQADTDPDGREAFLALRRGR